MSGSRVYVGGIPNDTRERDLEHFFRGYGRLNAIMVKLVKHRCAFVDFDDSRDCEKAIHDLNGKKLLGTRVTVEIARGKPRGRDRWISSRNNGNSSREKNRTPIRTKFRLTVRNLSSTVGWQSQKDYMRKAGEVTYGDAHRHNRNEGVVEFATHSDLKAAIRKLDGTKLNGRRIHLVGDVRAGEYNRRSKSQSHSGSRSRSRYSRSSSGSYSSRRNSKSRSLSASTKEESHKRDGRSSSRNGSRLRNRKE